MKSTLVPDLWDIAHLFSSPSAIKFPEWTTVMLGNQETKFLQNGSFSKKVKVVVFRGENTEFWDEANGKSVSSSCPIETSGKKSILGFLSYIKLQKLQTQLRAITDIKVYKALNHRLSNVGGFRHPLRCWNIASQWIMWVSVFQCKWAFRTWEWPFQGCEYLRLGGVNCKALSLTQGKQ